MKRDPQDWMEGHGPKLDLIDQVLQKWLEDEGLPCSRMLSASKSGYCERFPDHDVFFNACIFIRVRESGWRSLLWPRYRYQQVWWGDLDLDLDSQAIQNVANQRQETLYVTRESYSWDGLTKDSFKNDRYGSIRVYEPTAYF